MSHALKPSIEQLYEVFSSYPLKPVITGCPCCVTESNKEPLHSKNLRKLEDEDISRYIFKAMTTWGDVNDFKHFLPRILELASTTDLMIDTFIILGKLEYGKWNTWDKVEVDCITTFLNLWANELYKNEDYFDSHTFLDINKITKNIKDAFNNWTIKLTDNSFRHLVQFLETHFHDLTENKSYFKDFSTSEKEFLLDWIDKKTPLLEKGFFYYENTDVDIAKDISDILYFIEQVKR